MGAEHPDQLRPLGDRVVACGVEPGEGVQQRPTRRRAAPSAGAPWLPASTQYAASTDASRTVGATAPLACSSASDMSWSRSAHVAEPPVEAVVDASPRAARRRPGPAAGRRAPGGRPARRRPARRWPAPSPARRRGRGRDRRRRAAPASPATPHRSRAPSPAPPRQQAAQEHRAVAHRQRGGRRRHELAQRHQVTLGDQAGERPGDVGSAGRTVTGLVALARPARAGLARPDPAVGGHPVAGLGAGAASPCGEASRSARSTVALGRPATRARPEDDR